MIYFTVNTIAPIGFGDYIVYRLAPIYEYMQKNYSDYKLIFENDRSYVNHHDRTINFLDLFGLLSVFKQEKHTYDARRYITFGDLCKTRLDMPDNSLLTIVADTCITNQNQSGLYAYMKLALIPITDDNPNMIVLHVRRGDLIRAVNNKLTYFRPLISIHKYKLALDQLIENKKISSRNLTLIICSDGYDIEYQHMLSDEQARELTEENLRRVFAGYKIDDIVIGKNHIATLKTTQYMAQSKYIISGNSVFPRLFANMYGTKVHNIK